MLFSGLPTKLALAFAALGSKNAIPKASQIGITPGAASLTDGFPPLTRTALSAGGVPPSGADMNGILYELSAIARWANAGGGYPFDSAFATDASVGGYPKGARIARSDGLGYWFNTSDNNTTDPEGAGAVAAGWVPDFTTGATLITMTNANVTLTALQYGKPIIVITGLLTANLNLIFPNFYQSWVVINRTTGAYTITAKTAAGAGVVVATSQLIVCDGTDVTTGNDAANSVSVNTTKGKFGYETGAGGSVTQATSKSTSVTLNARAGQITLNASALAASTTAVFVLNNSHIASNLDMFLVKAISGFAGQGTYQVWAEGGGASNVQIAIRNISGGSLSEAIVLSFALVSGANA
jgi:hypothetical protein